MVGCGKRANKTSHRKSFISNTSPTLPRCHSPMSSKVLSIIYIYICNITHLFKLFIFNLDSPLESPKVVHSQPHFPFASIKR